MMEGAKEKRENAAMNRVSGDLMHKLMKRKNENKKREVEEDEELELSLGLSLNGRFGVYPTRKKIRRPSSVSNVVVNDISVDNECGPQERGVVFGANAPLVRACLMASETQEWRRRKEFRAVRSMEKLKNAIVLKEENYSQDVNGNGLHGDANGISDFQGQL